MAEETTEQTAVETAPETTEPQAPAQEGSESTAPDLSEQVKLLKQRLDRDLPAQQEEPAPQIDGASLADRLLGVDGDEDYEDTFAEEGEEEQEVHPIVQEIEQIKGYLANREHQDRLGELNTLVNEYPELAETATQEKIAGALGPLADRYGDAVLVEPTLIRQALLAIKAEAASAQETPAEEARNRGASLESEAGARTDSDEQDDNAAVAREIVESGPKESVFG